MRLMRSLFKQMIFIHLSGIDISMAHFKTPWYKQYRSQFNSILCAPLLTGAFTDLAEWLQGMDGYLFRLVPVSLH